MFAGFTDTDFEAYAPQKWRSNVFNRERLEVKQKLVAFGRELGAHLLAADGSPLTLEASVEHPALWNHKQVDSQHVFFSRNEGARKEIDAIIDRGKSLASMIDDPTPQRNHLFLVVTLTHDRVEVALKLHPDARVDRQNLERKAAEHFECERLLHLINRLGERYSVGVTGGESRPVGNLVVAQLESTITDLAKAAKASALPPTPGAAPQQLWFVGITTPRAGAVAAAGAFAAEARASLDALLPLYQYIAWSRDNDFLSMREVLQKEKQTKRQRGLAKNDEVRIVRGMFSGKSGVIQEIDARGGIKILVGKLAVKVDADDVVAVPRR